MHMVRPDDGIVVDVGAHGGEWSALMIEHQPGAKIHAFEPMPEPFARLRRLPVVAHQVALADAPGTLNMHGDGMIARLTAIGGAAGTDVEVRTLDSFVFPQIELLKIDVEGREMRVLHGAIETLGRTRMIQWEMGPYSIEERVYLKDFFHLLCADFRIFRIMRHGLSEIPHYDEHEEAFLTTNYLAIRRSRET